MWLSIASVWGSLFVGSVLSADPYIQDYAQFSALVKCAARAVETPVNRLTLSKCPSDAVGLRSCACTKDGNSASVWSDISTTMSYSCGSNAVEDLKSASNLFSLYCNTAANTAYTTPAPGPNAVTDYIWDLSAYSDLAPCATSALSSLVRRMTSSQCHEDPAALASCVCTKDQNSRYISSEIKTTIGYSCGTSGTADLTSAVAVWNGFCQLGDGKTNFPTPTPLPGLVTYNIWDLPLFSKLVPCAASALSRQVDALTDSECPSGARELVSCACAKDRLSSNLSREIATTVGYSCGETAKSDITSAQAVLAYYCSAGLGLVTPEGITVSASSTTSSVRTTTTSGTGKLPAETSKSPTDTSSASGGGKISIGPIAGGVAGALVLLLVAGFAFWRYRKNHRKADADSGDTTYTRHELAGTESSSSPGAGAALLAGLKSPTSTSDKPSPGDQPPVYPINGGEKPPAPTAEMYTPPAPYRAEVQGGAPPLPPRQQQWQQGQGQQGQQGQQYEMYGSQQQQQQWQGQGQQQGQWQQGQPQQYEMYGSQQQPGATMNQSPAVYEMDARRY